MIKRSAPLLLLVLVNSSGCHRDRDLPPRCELRPDLPGCGDATVDGEPSDAVIDSSESPDVFEAGADSTTVADTEAGSEAETGPEVGADSEPAETAIEAGPATETGTDAVADVAPDTTICGVGEKKCVAGKAQTCSASRLAWDEESCVLGCQDGACIEVKDLVGGMNHFCALLSNGTLRCWGSNAYGQIGTGAEAFWKPTLVAGVSDIVQVGIGGASGMARLKDGTLKWWGWAAPTGGDPVANVPPTTVSGISGVSEMAFSGYHACARVGDGSVKCFGENDYGQLGDGTTVAKYPPTFATVRFLSSPTALSLGDRMSLAILGGSSTEARGWGNNSYGELGIEMTGWSVTYVTEPQVTYAYATQIAGKYTPTCARYGDGTVKCSGINSKGEVGDGTTTTRWTPTAVKSLTGATEVRVGSLFACALLSGGTVSCWGANSSGQLGDGTRTDSSTPVAVPTAAVSGVRKLALSAGAACALIGKSTVRCWGANIAGQLGANLDPDTTEMRVTPVDVVW